MSKSDVESAGFTDVVFVNSHGGEKGHRESRWSTYVGKKNEKSYEISVTNDDNPYKGEPPYTDITSREISESEYMNMVRARQ